MGVDAKGTAVEIRIPAEELRAVEEAAAELGLSHEEFVREAARERASEVLTRRDADALTPIAARRVADALVEDGPPSPALRELFRRPSPFE